MVGKSKANTIIIDEVSLVEATDPLGEHSAVDTRDHENNEDYPLPLTITLDVTYMRNGKPKPQSDQYNIDPDVSFEQFQEDLRVNIDDTMRLQDDEEVVLEWKWEKRVTQQSVNKRNQNPYSTLSRERHWDTVLRVLRDAYATKNGCTNMLLKIRANIIKKNSQMDDMRVQEEDTGRVVITFFTLLTIDCHIKTTWKTS
jgi:hypothetical protein